MEIEEIRAMIPETKYFNLGKPVGELGEKYVRAMFNEKDILSAETLYDLFDGYCVTKDDGYTKTIAMGFIGDIPTQAYTNGNAICVYACAYVTDWWRWRAAVFENLFQMDEADIREHTTIFDAADDFLIDIEFQGDTRILLRYYFNKQKETA